MSLTFEDYRLDLARRELSLAGEVIATTPKVFDLLAYLVQNRERVVSRDDLLEAVWQGRIVSESTLASHINAVRRAIGDTGSQQRLVRTVSRKGFRFVGEATELDSPQTELSQPVEQVAQEPAPASSAHPSRPSIAVLPFVNLSGDPQQDYFADGVVEDIIAALSRLRWLFVIARNSSFTYKGRTLDVRQVGRELGVRYVLEGSVRKAADRVRLTGQIVDAGTGRHLWADRFEGVLGDIFELQDRLSESVVGAIARSWNAPRSAARSRSRPEAWTPTTATCAAWPTSTSAPARPSTRRCRSSTRRSSSIRNTPPPTAWPRGAIAGARSTAGWWT